MDRIGVVAVWDFSAGQMQRLRAADPRVDVRCVNIPRGEDMLPYVRDAQVLLAGDLPFDLAETPQLAWVQTPSAGVNHLLDHPIMQSDIYLTTASGIHAVPIAEHVLGMMLSWCRRLPVTARWQRDATWRPAQEPYRAGELRGATIGIVGYGSIGRQVARLARGVGMRVLAARRTPGRQERGWCEPGVGDPAGEIPERIYCGGEFRSMLPECDYVVMSAPLTRETRHLIGAGELASMKPGAYLVNIARGGLIDEAALTSALREGTIAGAGLDVFETEPLDAGSPLWQLANVTVTPHVAGMSHLYSDRLALLFADNLSRYAAGKPLENLVDKERGY